MQTQKRSTSAFTVAELSVAAAVVCILGGVTFTLLSAGTTLYAQNTSINQTHSGSRVSAEKILSKLAAAAEVPALTDEARATMTGTSPAAGVRFNILASPRAYPVSGAVSATATSFTIIRTTSQDVPQIGDKIAMWDLGFQGLVGSGFSRPSRQTISCAERPRRGCTARQRAHTAHGRDSGRFPRARTWPDNQAA